MIPRLLLITATLGATLAIAAAPALAQNEGRSRPAYGGEGNPAAVRVGFPHAARRAGSEVFVAPEPARLKGTSTRQALLIGGLAASIAAYGYFVLQFNNSRGAASDAELAYEEDVRQNAQSYLDQGTELDRIQTFRDWQDAYDDAKRSREWAARAGFLAIVIGFFGILDAATSYDSLAPRASGTTVRPTVGLTPIGSDFLVGAKLKF